VELHHVRHDRPLTQRGHLAQLRQRAKQIAHLPLLFGVLASTRKTARLPGLFSRSTMLDTSFRRSMILPIPALLSDRPRAFKGSAPPFDH